MSIPTPHIEAIEVSEVASNLLLPGDPIRAKKISERFFNSFTCTTYNTVRNMFGFTGKPNSSQQRISVQGSGMGMPSLSIYVHELIREYGVKKIIRVGSCGSLREDLPVGSVVIAQGACSDSNLNNIRFPGMNFAPIADWNLLFKAVNASEALSIPVRVGNIFSTDLFYDFADSWKRFAEYGAIAIEMESAELYTVAAKFDAQALTILTVSDNLVTGEKLSSEERESNFDNMVNIALEAFK